MQLFATPWTAACQASLFFTISWSLLKFTFIESVMLSNHSILCPLLLCLPSIFPSISLFWRVSFLHEVAKVSERASALASVLPVNIQDWFPLGLTWLVWSPCCPRDSQESSPAPQFKSINSSMLSFLYGPTLTSIHDYWKNHNFRLPIKTSWDIRQSQPSSWAIFFLFLIDFVTKLTWTYG